jgi:hypothetical protein
MWNLQCNLKNETVTTDFKMSEIWAYLVYIEKCFEMGYHGVDIGQEFRADN